MKTASKFLLNPEIMGVAFVLFKSSFKSITMKYLKTKMLIIGSLLIIFLLSTNTKVYSQDASYEETVEWMKGKLEKFTRSKYTNYGGVNNRWRFTDKYTYKVGSTDKCTFRIIESKRHTTNQTTARNDYTTTTVIEFSFSDIKSITYSTDDYNDKGFLIKTYNDANKIVINPDGSNAKIVSKYWIQAKELGELNGQPERFIKAFKNAMSLCGARTEKF